MYSVYQHWDPLKVCIVGRSYSPEFYSFITNSRVRTVMERIARETEEDYQKLVDLLESFGVEVLRPTLTDDYTMYIENGKIVPPPMTPRDFSIMLGSKLIFMPSYDSTRNTQECVPEPEHFPEQNLSDIHRRMWAPVIQQLAKTNPIYTNVPKHLERFGAALITRVGRDIYMGTEYYGEDINDKLQKLSRDFPEYRWHGVDTGGHSDGTYCPVKPGLIVSLNDIPTYKDTFPNWEVVYLPGQSWSAVSPFLKVKNKNHGKWWVPGEELNDDFTKFVEQWLSHWVGFVEETVFDVNMLVIDQHNVVCNNYNKEVFDAFDRYKITPHVINFRHRYFWDGGLHCITSDIHREGTMQDYFPERG